MINIFIDLLIRVITLDYFVIRHTISKLVKKSSLASQAKVLDIGCGTGALAHLFPKNGYLGFDIDWRSVNIAKKRNPGYKFIVANATYPSIVRKKFDLILISGVIHHLNETQFNKTINVVKDHLQDAGRALFIEAIPPISNWNIIGKILRKFDQGQHIRKLEKYVVHIKRRLKVIDSYEQPGGLVDYGVVIASN